jgi:hypothetical protein
LDFLAPPQKPGGLGRLGRCRVLKVLRHVGTGPVLLTDDAQLEGTIGLKVTLPRIESSFLEGANRAYRHNDEFRYNHNDFVPKLQERYRSDPAAAKVGHSATGQVMNRGGACAKRSE